MSNICKIGPFSDGNTRIRVVAPGYNADPAPSDRTQIIFDSDWPEVIVTRSGFYGSASVSFVTNSSGTRTSPNYNATWPTLGYSPLLVLADPPRWQSPPSIPVYGSSVWQSLVASAYEITIQNALSSYSVPGPSGFTYIPSGEQGYSTNPHSETYTIGWWAMLIDTTLLGNATPPSRAGTSCIQLSNAGPVVTKPGASVTSTNLDDFLIPPVSSGAILGQPYMAATVTSLPLQTGFTRSGTTYYEYYVTIPHSLGYMPFCFTTNCYDALIDLPSTSVFVDATNIYIYTYTSTTPGITLPPLSIAPVSYFIFRPQWF